MIHPVPHYQDMRELGTAGGSLGAANLITSGPTANTPARYIRVVDITTGAVLEVTLANGNTRAYTVAAGDEFWADFTATTANTTCDVLLVGWD